MPNKLEVEGKEILIKSSNGTMAVIPKDKVSMVKGYIDSGNHGAVDKFVGTLKEFKHENQKAGDGLYANIHAKRARIAAGSGERMRKVGEAGAPTAGQFKQAAKTAKAEDGVVIAPAMLETLKRIQDDKARKAIVVSNPNDPRLKAYQDSLALYNANEQARGQLEGRIKNATKEFGASGVYKNPIKDDGVLLPPKEVVVKKYKTQPLDVKDKTIYTTNGGFPEIDPVAYNLYLRKFGSHSVMGTNKQVTLPFNKDREESVTIGQFKKPEQPVVYQKSIKKPTPPPRNNGNTRPDGTKKGKGFLGEIKRPDGKVSTELSIGVNIDGKEVLIPTMVPGLTKEEITHLTSGKYNPQARKGIDDVISRKAIEFAKERAAKKQPFFATPEEEGKFKLETTPDPEPIAPRMPSTEIIDTSQPIATPEPVTVTQPAQPVLKEVIEAEKPVIRKLPKAIMPRRQGGWSNQPLLMRMFPKLYIK